MIIDGITDSTGTGLLDGLLEAGDFSENSILQILTTTTSSGSNNTTSSFSDVGGLSISITPKFANSKILIMFSGGFAMTKSGGGGDFVAVFRILKNNVSVSSTTIRAVSDGPSNDYDGAICITHSETLSALTSITYKIQSKLSASAIADYVATGTGATLTIFEIKQ